MSTFVYGTFLTSMPSFFGALGGLSGVDSYPDFAIEILREFGPNEFIGKVYHRVLSGSWTPWQMESLQKERWYEQFLKNRSWVVFDMQGSGPWEILHFRVESDTTGPYLAVALRLMSDPPTWISTARARWGR